MSFTYQTRSDRTKLLIELLALFAIALAASFIIFTVINENRHDQIKKAMYINCTKTELVAANQRRVILALLDLEESEIEHKDGEHTADLKYALNHVPKFDCRR